jgi:Spy/CpxP family protein refolding chaperone
MAGAAAPASTRKEDVSMRDRTFQTVAILAAVALIGTVTVAVVASGGARAQDSGFLGHLHSLVGQHLHGGGGQHDPMAQLVETLNLTPDQLERFEKLQEVVESDPSGGHESMAALHEVLLTQFEQGQIGIAETRQAVDGHIEEMRVLAYAVTDELIALVNELDDTQRATMLEHLQQTGAGAHGH